MLLWKPLAPTGLDALFGLGLYSGLPRANLSYLGLQILAGTAVVTALLMFVFLFVGPPRCRSLRAWLAFTGLTAAWLAIIGLRHDIAWVGQKWRANSLVAQFEPVAASLRDNWPVADDVTDELGPFSAYPNGRPTILMPLLKPTARGVHAPFSVIERSNRHALRFELLGNNNGAWLEWHPKGSTPASFVGGLDTEYRLLRASELGDGWYLTRYKAEGLSKSL